MNLNDSLITIGKSAFEGCGGFELIIPNSVTTIGERAFYDCSGLTSLSIPASVSSIGYAAFAECGNLAAVVAHKSQKKMLKSGKSMIFSACYKLKKITYVE